MHCVFRLSRTLVSKPLLARVTLSRPPSYLSATNQSAWAHSQAAAPVATTSASDVRAEPAKKADGSEPQSTTEAVTEPATTASSSSSPSDALVDFRWDDIVTEVATKAEITSAIVPWSELNFVQKLFYPYTYSLMHYLDVLSTQMPWWTAILATSASIKLLFFPFVVHQQKIAVRTHNIQPQIQELNVGINQALLSGDTYQLAMNRSKLNTLLKQHDVTVMQRLWPAFIQTPMFMSFFFLLRKLTDELDCLSTAGILWFTDLTVPDPLMVLPLTTSLSMLLLLELGMGSEATPGTSVEIMKPVARWLLRALPLGMFFLIFKFPAATLLFWASSNLLSLVFAILFKSSLIRMALRIPERVIHNPKDLPLASQTLSGQLKSAKEMGRKTKTAMDLRRLDDMAFRKAGVGPLKKTYDEPPSQSK